MGYLVGLLAALAGLALLLQLPDIDTDPDSEER